MTHDVKAHVVTLHDRWLAWSLDRYGILLGILVIDYLALLLMPSDAAAALCGVVTVGGTVLFALDVSGVNRNIRIAVRCMVGVLPVMAALYFLAPHLIRGVVGISFGLVLAATPVVILLRLLGHERVNMATLLAALDVYVLIGLVFAELYYGFAQFKVFNPFLAQAGQHTRSDFAYLSYVTLTTVGFGDLTPKSSWARSLVITEALIGNMVLVTAVARVVSLYGRTQTSLKQSEEETPSDH